MLYAFDLLEIDGEDLRPLPLSDRKRKLMKLVGKRRVGIVLSAHRRGRRLDLSAGVRDGARQTSGATASGFHPSHHAFAPGGDGRVGGCKQEPRWDR
jgi:ATP-dependent DNA ligase